MKGIRKVALAGGLGVGASANCSAHAAQGTQKWGCLRTSARPRPGGFRLHPPPSSARTPELGHRRAHDPATQREKERGQPAAGGWGLTLAGRRAGDAAWGVAGDSVPFHAGRVWRRVTEQAQQLVVLAEGWEGTDGQLHLGKATWGSCRGPLPNPGSCQRGHPTRALVLRLMLPPEDLMPTVPETGPTWSPPHPRQAGPGSTGGRGTPQSIGSPCFGSAHRAQARSETPRVSCPSPQLGQQRPSPRTFPRARRLMFCGWAPVTATQDSSRLHSQWPLSSARGHLALLVHLQERGTASVPVPVGPRA